MRNRFVNRCWILAVAAGSIASLAAAAEVCVTQSGNIPFVSAPAEVDSATTDVLSQCQHNPVTNNDACANNLFCGFSVQSPYPSGRAVCTTNSHNIGFQSGGDPLNINQLTQAILDNCTHTGVSNNGECSARVACVDSTQAVLPYPSGQVSCSTTSKGLPFQQIGSADAVGSLANSVLIQCQHNSVTDNNECSSNLSCTDGGSNSAALPANIHCHTESHNIPFVGNGPRDQINDVTKHVLDECQRNPVANNDECNRNLKCD